MIDLSFSIATHLIIIYRVFQGLTWAKNAVESHHFFGRPRHKELCRFAGWQKLEKGCENSLLCIKRRSSIKILVEFHPLFTRICKRNFVPPEAVCQDNSNNSVIIYHFNFWTPMLNCVVVFLAFFFWYLTLKTIHQSLVCVCQRSARKIIHVNFSSAMKKKSSWPEIMGFLRHGPLENHPLHRMDHKRVASSTNMRERCLRVNLLLSFLLQAKFHTEKLVNCTKCKSLLARKSLPLDFFAFLIRNGLTLNFATIIVSSSVFGLYLIRCGFDICNADQVMHDKFSPDLHAEYIVEVLHFLTGSTTVICCREKPCDLWVESWLLNGMGPWPACHQFDFEIKLLFSLLLLKNKTQERNYIGN